MNRDDRVFWERMAEMPLVEQVDECVHRREQLALVIPVIQRAQIDAKARGNKLESERLSSELFAIGAQNQLLNERLRHIRRIANDMTWTAAIRESLGDEAYEKVKVWRAMREQANLPMAVPA